MFCADLLKHKHRYTHKHRHTHSCTHTDSLLSLLSLHHHANPACFTRQETERLIVIPQGSADLSQICLCLAPHSTSFLYCRLPGIRKSLIFGIYWKCGKSVSEALSLGDS